MKNIHDQATKARRTRSRNRVLFYRVSCLFAALAIGQLIFQLGCEVVNGNHIVALGFKADVLSPYFFDRVCGTRFRWSELSPMACSIMPLVWVWLNWREYLTQRKRWTRFRDSKCVECGYDLRFSPRICPECGNERTVDLGPPVPRIEVTTVIVLLIFVLLLMAMLIPSPFRVAAH